MTQRSGHVDEREVEIIFNQLKPVSPSFLVGEWDGGDIDTGHIGHKRLAEMRWAGKAFRSMDDGDPIIVHDNDGNRVWDKAWGHSSVSVLLS